LGSHPLASVLGSALAKIHDVARFVSLRRRYYRRFQSDKSLSESGDLFETLTREGIAIVPNFLEDQQARAMLVAVPPLESFQESPEGDRAFLYPNAERIAAFKPFFESTLIESLARAYISPQAVAHRRTIGIKSVPGPIATFEMFYHMDTWKQRLKAWCYLDDVGPHQAPMVYLRRSHRPGMWRLQTEADLAFRYRTTPAGFATEDSLYMGCFWPHHVEALKERYGFSDVVCTGPAGTLIVFDGRGLHRATPLSCGRRAVLLSYWVDRDDR
jgi:hypothetical protein